MDSSTTSIKSTDSTSSSRRPVGATRQVSNVSARSRSTLSPGGSPKTIRKGSTPGSRVGTTPNRTPVGSAKIMSGVNAKQTRKTNPLSTTSHPGRAEKERAQEGLLKATNGAIADRRASLNSAKAKVDVGNRRPEKPKANGTSSTKSAASNKLSSGTEATARKSSTPKERTSEKIESLNAKRMTRDLNRNSAREKPIRSDSSDLEAASKLISAKVYELRTQLVNNGLIMAPIKDFIGQRGIESFVVLPLGRFSQNSKSLWRASMMELLLEVAVPKRRIFLDSSLIDLERESLRSHAFVHRGDTGIPDDVEMRKDSVVAPGPTLVFAPSPDLISIEAILRAYEERDRLSELLIIGYSLHKLAEQVNGLDIPTGEQVSSIANLPSNNTTVNADGSILTRLLPCIDEETFPFDLFPQSAFAPIFAELRGHRVRDYPSRLVKSGSRYSQEMRAASCDTLLTERSGSDDEIVIASDTGGILKTASSAPNLASPPPSRVPTALLTVGAICCGAGLAWMFINKR